MTRKKSNVKALALAVTCAILAGGYSGLNPVYAAADTLYKDGTNVTTSNTPSGGSGSNEAIEQLTVGSVTIGGTGGDAGQIIAKNIVGITNVGDITPSAISINGATFANGGAITANGLTADSVNIGGLTISSVASGSTTSANNYIAGIKDSSGAVTAIGISGTKFESNGAITASSLTLENSIGNVADYVEKNRSDIATNKAAIADNATDIAKKANQTDLNTANGKITALEEKTAKFNDDGTTLTGMDEVSAATLKVDGREITGEKVDGYDAAVEKTANITRNTDGSTTVDGVKFKAGAVSGVSGINDDILQFTQNGTENIVQINSDLRLNDNTGGKAAILSVEGLAALNSMVYDATGKINNDAAGKPIIQAGNGSVVGGVKLDNKNIANVDSITVNEGKENQVKITSEGIVVGLTSAAINGDGFYAGGHNYNDAKAALDGKDGKIKGAGGKFGVDEYGNVTTTGDIKGKDVTVDGKLSANGDAVVGGDLSVAGKAHFTQEANFAGGITTDAINEATPDKGVTIDGVLLKDQGISAAGGNFTVDGTTGNTTVGGTLKSKGNFSVGDADQFTVDAATGNVVSKGKITSDRAKIGAVEIANDGTITGVKAITTDTLTVNNGFITNGNIESKGLKVNGNAEITGTLGVNGAVTGASFNGATIDATHFNNVTLSGGNVEANSIKGTTLTDGIAKMNGGKVTAQNGVEVDANNYLNSSGLKTSNIDASQATIGKIEIKGSKIKSTEADGTVGIAGITVNDAGALNNVNFIDGVSIGAVTGGNGLQFGGNAVVGATNKPFSSTGFEVDSAGNVTGKSFNVNGSNYLDSNGLTAKAATIGGVNKLNNTGIDTSGKLHVGDLATFGDSSSGNYTTVNGGTVTVKGEAGNKGGTTTTISGGKITTDTLYVQDIVLHNQMKDGSGNTIKISGSDGSMSVAGGKFAVDDKGQVTNHITATGAAAADTIFTTSETGIDATFQKNGETASSGLKIDYNHAALNASGGAALDLNGTTATLGIGTDVTRVMTNSTTKAIVDKVDAASRSLTANQIVDTAGGTTITTNNTGTTFSNGTPNNNTLINGSAITSTKATGDTGLLDGSNLTLKVTDAAGNVTRSTELTAGGATFTKDGKTTTIDGNTIKTGHLITDKLTITGSGNADGTGSTPGSIAFGGNGTIKSNIKGEVGTVDEGKETTFETKLDGVNTKVTDGTATSNNTQTATSIGSVITNGTVTIGSVADASSGVLQNSVGTVNGAGAPVTEASQKFSKDGSITSVAKDADGKSTLVQNGTGLVYTDSANTGNATRINSSDVSIGSATDDSKRINLSDLGQLNDLDGELTARSEYTSNPTAVGAINAEAGIRREEVARLDNRIDDVNNRVDKVGAMAAAIASLKSIGYDPQAPSEFSIGLGQYKGETGVAMGFFHYPNKNFMINVSLSTAGGETMGGIGATWRFGHKSPQKLLEEQREAQAKKELAAAEKYQAAAKLAKEAQERAEYAAKLARQAQVSADNAKAAADATQAKHFQ